MMGKENWTNVNKPNRSVYNQYKTFKALLATRERYYNLNRAGIFLDPEHPDVKWMPEAEIKRINSIPGHVKYRKLTLDEFVEWYYAERTYLQEEL